MWVLSAPVFNQGVNTTTSKLPNKARIAGTQFCTSEVIALYDLRFSKLVLYAPATKACRTHHTVWMSDGAIARRCGVRKRCQ